jgi:very-short-patch-repair endonuclease
MNRPQEDAAVFRPVIGAETQLHPVDAVISALAERQHGVVSRDQLSAVGIGRRAIGHRLECGRLLLIHRGVFAVGHRALSREGRWLAAVLAAGPGAALSHQSAAALWLIRETARGRIDVTVPVTRRPRMTIHIHEARLPVDELTTTQRIPVTTPARTLLDLAAVVSHEALEKAINEAERLHLASTTSLADLLHRHHRRPGTPAIQRILDAGFVGVTVTKSKLEDDFLAFLDNHGLPRPDVNPNMPIDGRWKMPDCVWRAASLIVELDGYETHGTRSAFENDRARDRALQVAGWRVVRVTWRQLHERPAVIASQLRTLLSSPAQS